MTDPRLLVILSRMISPTSGAGSIRFGFLDGTQMPEILSRSFAFLSRRNVGVALAHVEVDAERHSIFFFDQIQLCFLVIEISRFAIPFPSPLPLSLELGFLGGSFLLRKVSS